MCLRLSSVGPYIIWKKLTVGPESLNHESSCSNDSTVTLSGSIRLALSTWRLSTMSQEYLSPAHDPELIFFRGVCFTQMSGHTPVSRWRAIQLIAFQDLTKDELTADDRPLNIGNQFCENLQVRSRSIDWSIVYSFSFEKTHLDLLLIKFVHSQDLRILMSAKMWAQFPILQYLFFG